MTHYHITRKNSTTHWRSSYRQVEILQYIEQIDLLIDRIIDSLIDSHHHFSGNDWSVFRSLFPTLHVRSVDTSIAQIRAAKKFAHKSRICDIFCLWFACVVSEINKLSEKQLNVNSKLPTCGVGALYIFYAGFIAAARTKTSRAMNRQPTLPVLYICGETDHGNKEESQTWYSSMFNAMCGRRVKKWCASDKMQVAESTLEIATRIRVWIYYTDLSKK